MPATTSFFVDPYFDDYTPSKNFFRVLYRPGVSVQARELTQVQSILQNQIEEHGRITIENGTAVSGGEISVDNSLTAVSVGDFIDTRLSTSENIISIENLIGKIITGQSGVRAKVVNANIGTLFVAYIGNGSFDATNGPVDITQEDDNNIQATIPETTSGVSTINPSLHATISEGIFFIYGFLVPTAEQKIILSQTTNTPSSEIIVGYNIIQTNVTSDSDTSLLDPAQGSFNENAPGANRFSIELTLTSITIDSSLLPHVRNSNENFSELFRINTNGNRIIGKNLDLIKDEETYSDLLYRAKGNYILEDFSADISGNTDIIKLNVGQGKAVIDGKLLEKFDKDTITVSNTKIETLSTTNQVLPQKFGNYLKGSLDSVSALFPITLEETQVFNLFSSTSTIGVSTQVGTCNIREFRYGSSEYLNIHISNLDFSDPISTILGSGITRISNSTLNQITIILGAEFAAESGAYNFSTIKLSNDIGESEVFTVFNHTVVASAHTFTLDKLPTKNGNNYTNIELNFNINMVKQLRTSDSVSIIGISDDGINSDGTVLFDSGLNSLSYELPLSGTSSVENVQYVLRVIEEITPSGTTTKSSIPIRSLSFFEGGVNVLSAKQKQENFFLYNLSGGDIVDLSDPDVIIEISDDFKSATIEGIVGGIYRIHYNLRVDNSNDGDRRGKTFISGEIDSYTTPTLQTGHFEISQSNTNKVQGGFDLLGDETGFSDPTFFDIQKLVAVLEVPAGDSFPGLITSIVNNPSDPINVTDRYILDNGQRDDRYEIGRIILKGNAPTPTGKLLVIVDRFDHGDTSKTHFTRSSYAVDTIPEYISERTGRSISTGDIIDFRRRLDNRPTEHLSSTSNLRVDLTNYLPRRDKVILYKNGTINIIEGIPSLDPKYPESGSQEFVLFLLDIPGYLNNLNDIKITKVEHRLHTQEEIGKIQNRVKNLEETSSLTNTESLAQNINITDNNGNNRFKTSVLVDTFNRNHSIGDIQNNDYNCSIDPVEKVLRPPFSSDAWKFDVSTNTGTSRTGDLLTLSYVPEIFIDQPYTSGTTKLNTADKTVFAGQLILGAPGDIWYDTSSLTRPFIGKNTKGKNDGWKELESEKVFGSHYNDWSTNWSGTESVEKYTNEKISRGTQYGTYDEELSYAYEDDVKINDKYIDQSIQQYVRSQEIVFVAKGLRSGTIHTLQVDDQVITSITRFGVRCPISGLVGNFIGRDGEFETVSIGSTVVGQIVSVLPNSLLIVPALGVSSTQFSGQELTGATSGATATVGSASTVTTLTSDSFGEVAAVFVISQGSLLTGNRVFRVTDNITLENTTSVAETLFYAKGLLNSKDSTRELEKIRKDLTDVRINKDTNSSSLLDSLSQIFTVSEEDNPNGIFLQNLHLFFSSKDISTAFGSHVSIEIRPVIGEQVSESEVIPYSKVFLHSTGINAITSGTTITIPTAEGSDINSTVFEFNAPVYLSPGSYAIVVKANNSDFSVHLADIGLTMSGSTETINKASHIGKLYLPRNAGNSLNQKMLMFRLNRCEFSTSGSVAQTNRLTSLGGLTSSSADTVKLVGEELHVSGTSLSHVFDTSSNIGKNVNYNFLSPRTIGSAGSFIVTSSLSTVDNKVSPVIDLSRFGLYTISNLVDNAGLKSTNFSVTLGGVAGTRDFIIKTNENDTGSSADVIGASDASGNLIGFTISSPGSGYFKSPEVIVLSSAGGPVDNTREVVAIGEDSRIGGNVLAKYITKRVTLEDGFSSKDLQVFVNANLPAETDINIYYKVLSDEDTGSFDDKSYYQMELKTKDLLDLNGNVKLIFGSENNNIIYESDGRLYNNFRQYAIKVVMTSASSSYVPKVKDIAIVSVI